MNLDHDALVVIRGDAVTVYGDISIPAEITDAVSTVDGDSQRSNLPLEA
jgi:hypothetical protein